MVSHTNGCFNCFILFNFISNCKSLRLSRTTWGSLGLDIFSTSPFLIVNKNDVRDVHVGSVILMYFTIHKSHHIRGLK